MATASLSPTPSLSPESPLSALALLLASGDPKVYESLAEEAGCLADDAPSSELWLFWMTFSEDLFAGMVRLSAPAPVVVERRRWFRSRKAVS